MLLGAVVQVALDAAALGLEGVHERGPPSREISDLRVELLGSLGDGVAAKDLCDHEAQPADAREDRQADRGKEEARGDRPPGVDRAGGRPHPEAHGVLLGDDPRDAGRDDDEDSPDDRHEHGGQAEDEGGGGQREVLAPEGRGDDP